MSEIKKCKSTLTKRKKEKKRENNNLGNHPSGDHAQRCLTFVI